ncbi:hypothetical protein LTR70_009519 [Exophiala xenobiotica]|nr:hypothetical protein LTR70_009519 [Exophiala xenobiotica]
MDESMVPAKTISFDATEAFSQGGFLLQSQLEMDLAIQTVKINQQHTVISALSNLDCTTLQFMWLWKINLEASTPSSWHLRITLRYIIQLQSTSGYQRKETGLQAIRSLAVTEVTPLLWQDTIPQSRSEECLRYSGEDDYHELLRHRDVSGNNAHAQFCALTGCPPSDPVKDKKYPAPKKSLYGRTVSQLSSQRIAYSFSAALNNTLLLSQVILGATLTALGASVSSHILITIFGVMNTIIAGLVAYLKSRGQPMRARMYRDDLERLVDEIENSEVMWRGISDGIHGYDEIDTDEVTVRSEVARLTRLYERAVRLNGQNNPDMYMAGAGGFDGNTSGGVRPSRGGPGLSPGAQNVALPVINAAAAPQPSQGYPGPAVPPVSNPEDAAPATKADMNKPDDNAKEENKGEIRGDGKKTSTDGTGDGDGSVVEPLASKPVTDTSNSAAAPTPDATQETPPSQPQSQMPLPVDDPDASPATAARLKPKRTKSNGKGHETSINAQKVSGDDEP